MLSDPISFRSSGREPLEDTSTKKDPFSCPDMGNRSTGSSAIVRSKADEMMRAVCIAFDWLRASRTRASRGMRDNASQDALFPPKHQYRFEKKKASVSATTDSFLDDSRMLFQKLAVGVQLMYVRLLVSDLAQNLRRYLGS